MRIMKFSTRQSVTVLVACLAALAYVAPAALAVSSLEGYYEAQTELNGQDRSWGLNNPRHYRGCRHSV